MRENPRPHLLVLVVDDSRDCAESLALLVRLWGHEAVVTYDGPAALEAARTRTPDVVLLDLATPEMDGYQLARRLRQLAGLETGLLVAITGLAPDVQRCQGAGIDCHFIKPLDPDELKQVLDRADRLGREHRQMACQVAPDLIHSS
jgi:two-component system, chemotaxis family, CheB/CheR fusion protein